MSADQLPPIVLCAATLVVCFHATGRAIVGRTPLAVPPLFAHVLASTISTTLVGTLLAAAEIFSLPALLAGNLLVGLAGIAIRRFFDARPDPVVRGAGDRIGPLVFLLALATYWPAFPVFLGGSDATAYVDSGISLARRGTLGLDDDLGPAMPRELRSWIFDSMSQVFESTGPPYRRVPGAILVESLDSVRAWPSFFPVPAVWGATLVTGHVTASAEAAEAATGYAPVFAALALWAFWLLARAWLEPAFAAVAVVLLGAATPFYLVARTPLSEPIAGFFTLAGLALLARSGGSLRASALAAGAAFGAAAFTRIEIALVVVLAMSLELFLRPKTSAGFDRGAFAVAFVAVASLTVIPAVAIPGMWTLPLTDHLRNGWIRVQIFYGRPSAALITVAIAGLATVAAALAKAIGWRRTLGATILVAGLGGQAASARFLYDRTPMWLSFFIGWSGLALAAIGAALAAKHRARLAGGPVVLAFAAIAAALLFYNPHVFPSVPWGARRYVPLLLPMLVLLATYAVRVATARHILLGVVTLVSIAAPIAYAVRPVFGRVLMEGSWATLHELDRAIPTGGTILVDRELSSLMIAPALWLVLDRNNLTVPPTGTPESRKILPAVVDALSSKGPLYFVTKGAGAPSRTPFVAMTLVGRATASAPSLEETYDRRPSTVSRFVTPIAIYRVEKSTEPRGTVAREMPGFDIHRGL